MKKDHPLYDPTNKKVIGKFKNECPNDKIVEFVGLRPKMYSIKTELDCNKTTKGGKKTVVIREITHDNYRETLFNKTSMRHEMNVIQSQLHNIYSF